MRTVTPEQVERTLKGIPEKSNLEIRRIRDNSRRLGVDRLVRACDEELSLRGSLDLSPEAARVANRQAEAVQGKPLPEVIRTAFSSIPATDDEIRLLNVLARMPGEQSAKIEEAYGKRDSSLVLGHLVYNRFGFFRQFLAYEKDQSSILVQKGKKAGLVTWRLKPETESELKDLNIIHDHHEVT